LTTIIVRPQLTISQHLGFPCTLKKSKGSAVSFNCSHGVQENSNGGFEHKFKAIAGYE
jgi:hypothetical protein